MTTLSPLLIENTIRAALEEDFGHGHDVTSAALISPESEMRAVLTAREDGVLAGLSIGLSAFIVMDSECDIEIHKSDGDKIKKGDRLATIEGPARSILAAERVCLNFVSHLSGIATKTAKFVEAVKGTDTKITDTRKTLPGLRAFQKYAVRCGGGLNHRFGLDDAVLIKDNHIAACGGVCKALDKVKAHAGHMVKIELEVDTMKQLDEALKHGGADIIMLDNFSIDEMKKAVQKIKAERPKIIIEASGGVKLETAGAIAKTGVDMISVGTLTHSAKALDIGLDYEAN